MEILDVASVVNFGRYWNNYDTNKTIYIPVYTFTKDFLCIIEDTLKFSEDNESYGIRSYTVATKWNGTKNKPEITEFIINMYDGNKRS